MRKSAALIICRVASSLTRANVFRFVIFAGDWFAYLNEKTSDMKIFPMMISWNKFEGMILVIANVPIPIR